MQCLLTSDSLCSTAQHSSTLVTIQDNFTKDRNMRTPGRIVFIQLRKFVNAQSFSLNTKFIQGKERPKGPQIVGQGQRTHSARTNCPKHPESPPLILNYPINFQLHHNWAKGSLYHVSELFFSNKYYSFQNNFKRRHFSTWCCYIFTLLQSLSNQTYSGKNIYIGMLITAKITS